MELRLSKFPPTQSLVGGRTPLKKKQSLMETREVQLVAVQRPVPTPKAIINQKFGSTTCYRIEEVKEPVNNSLPGLLPQIRTMYRCTLDLPELSVTSGIFTKKKDAEQSAAKIAIEKLGIQSKENVRSPQEALTELVARMSGFFTTEFLLSSSHPLLGHFRVAMKRDDKLCGMIPLYAVAACDMKVNNFCKIINPQAESNPLVVFSILLKAALMSSSICIADGEFWIQKKSPFSSENLQSLTSCSSGNLECKHVEAIRVPCTIEEHIETLELDVSDNMYYMDEIAKKLNARNSSRVLVSRTVGKASSELRLFFAAPEVSLLSSDSSVNLFENMDGNEDIKLNKRASYISGQNIYGDAILANVGYTWKSPELFYEDVSLCTYYRVLLHKVPDGHYKLSREAVLAAELPTVYTRSNWRGPSPKNLLSFFCNQHRLSEPIFNVNCPNSGASSSEQAETSKKMRLSNITNEVQKANGSTGNGNLTKSSNYRCEVKLLTKRQEPLVECSFNTAYRKESDAIQNAALQVLAWLNKYFKQLDMPVDNLCYFGGSHSVNVFTQNFSQQFSLWSSVHSVVKCTFLGSACIDQPNIRQETGTGLFNVEGLDSGIFPSAGSLTCISYTVTLGRKGESLREPLENNDAFEFEVGTGAVINQLETCVAQLSSDQSARFTIELPSRELIMAASNESTKRLQELSLHNCFLEYFVKVLKVTEPFEERMEQALFQPPLSKQRVEFAVRRINESHATTLVDFGCGSGSLLNSLMQHTTTLEKIVGVDISCKSLARAAKILHSKLSMNPEMQPNIKSAVLYDGSITDFDSRLYGFDIGTCLEVIEHMEEDQADMFGDAVLSLFCPRMLIVSTPNYEYNAILQRASLPDKEDGKEDDPEEKSAPCKFRNHDHKFEWTREQFQHWATDLAKKHNYSVEFSGVGSGAGERGTEEPGFASQIAIFRSMLQQTEKCLSNAETSHIYKVIWEWPTSEDVNERL